VRCAAATLFVLALVSVAHGADKPGNKRTLLAPGNLIEIRISGLFAPGQEVTLEQHVDDDGTVPLPLVGAVKISGKDAEEAAAAIDHALADAKLVQRAGSSVVLEKPGTTAAAIAVGDRVRIRMWDVEGPGKETSHVETVAKDGTIAIPLLGRAKLEGLTESKAMRSLALLYKKAQLIADLPVAVLRLDADAAAPRDRP
jgi:protein involved in polysaccharide export with SLBB domain